MRTSMLIAVILVGTILGGLLSSTGYWTESAKRADAPVIDTTDLTLAVKDLPTVQVDEPF